ncbi:MAG: hypothetical protein A2W91_14775 [Bacteroidetes bacterium GWF2_38_335]|nr:MAG: hypothetical protein A2W91_14775 [Bacteroidetes bacterium GWF2_38_335]OFY78465.1 MAG: hypothetical protein A2281_16085 [Bacteroidetes bacterium RIFOXYA12_FULL_38_20]HBS88412.1 hypothetical protein [Bacteroidales bacterium]
MNLYSEKLHDRIYIICLTVFAIVLPLSNFITTVNLVLIVVNWIIGGSFRKKMKVLSERKGILIFLLLFVIHLIWLFNTNDFNYAFNDIKVKLPLFFLPLVVGTSVSLDFNDIRRVIYALTVGCIVASMVSIWYYTGLSGKVIYDTRDISVFMSHIRFSLIINFSFFALLYLALKKNTGLPQREKLFVIIAALWLFIFLFILKSFTGFFVLFFTGFMIILILTSKQKSRIIQLLLLLLLLAIPMIPGLYLKNRLDDFYETEITEDLSKLDSLTDEGNVYLREINPYRIENGHYVDIYLCEDEMRPAWNKRSKLDYDGKDLNSGDLKFTLIRYLTSLGLKKDGVSVRSLSEQDIKNVENGVANYKYPDPLSLNARVYQVIWQIDAYMRGGSPDGHSITQRLEYLKASRNIIYTNFWIGVGTGDLKIAFKTEYEKMGSSLKEKFRLRAHNQFVTFWIAFGLIGFLICIFALMAPVVTERKYKDYFFLVFIVIAILSMLNEDTLEGQAGVAFFSYLYSIFVFGKKDNHRL